MIEAYCAFEGGYVHFQSPNGSASRWQHHRSVLRTSDHADNAEPITTSNSEIATRRLMVALLDILVLELPSPFARVSTDVSALSTRSSEKVDHWTGILQSHLCQEPFL
jgi:hypothetical protein